MKLNMDIEILNMVSIDFNIGFSPENELKFQNIDVHHSPYFPRIK
jgi:hypothetical protein